MLPDWIMKQTTAQSRRERPPSRKSKLQLPAEPDDSSQEYNKSIIKVTLACVLPQKPSMLYGVLLIAIGFLLVRQRQLTVPQEIGDAGVTFADPVVVAERIKKVSDEDYDDAAFFFTNTPHDYRVCTSPERNVPWPLGGDAGDDASRSKTSQNLTCGFKADTPFADYFSPGGVWHRQFYQPLISRCTNMVVFGVALGRDFVGSLDGKHVREKIDHEERNARYGKCFFMLTTQSDVEWVKMKRKVPPGQKVVTIGHYTLIPLPESVLPYANPRRNAKLLKYAGHYMFPDAKTIIWQDAKFFRKGLLTKQPLDYRAIIDEESCVSAIGLPAHESSVGWDYLQGEIKKYGRYTGRTKYKDHCHHVISALAERPNVTDSKDNLLDQCDAYLQEAYKQDGNVDILNEALIDTGFIVWNHKTQRCRDFSSSFRCTVADQIHCHSDRDQPSVPFAVHKMGLVGTYKEKGKDRRYKKVDKDWDSNLHDLDFVTPDHSGVKFRVTRSRCHWYYKQIGNCDPPINWTPYIAVVVVVTAASIMKFKITSDYYGS